MTPKHTLVVALTALMAASLVAAPMGVAAMQDTDESDASFSAYGQEGTIVLAGDHDDPIQIPESDQDQPLPENAPADTDWEDESFSIDAAVDREAGTWSAGSEDVTVPTITTYDVNADHADVTLSTPNGLEGTFDPDSGEMTFEGTLEIQAEVIEPLGGLAPDSTCVTQTEIEGTSDDLDVDEDSGTATATISDDTFTVPGMDLVDGADAVCDAAEDQYSLPADESGENEFELDLWMDLDGFDDADDGDDEDDGDDDENGDADDDPDDGDDADDGDDDEENDRFSFLDFLIKLLSLF